MFRMSIKSHLDAANAKDGHYAIMAPRRTDTISGALRQAFEAPPLEDRNFSALLTRIDHADRARGHH